MPPAEPTAAAGSDLFVQTVRRGTLTPTPGAAGRSTLSREGDGGQTVYFSDRPARGVGLIPTAALLEQIGFTPADPRTPPSWRRRRKEKTSSASSGPARVTTRRPARSPTTSRSSPTTLEEEMADGVLRLLSFDGELQQDAPKELINLPLRNEAEVAGSPLFGAGADADLAGAYHLADPIENVGGLLRDIHAAAIAAMNAVLVVVNGDRAFVVEEAGDVGPFRGTRAANEAALEGTGLSVR
jgi:hypothetical protein